MNSSIHIICVLATIFSLASAGAVRASGEGGIHARIASVVIDASEAGYRFSVKMDIDDSLQLIEVEWGGKKFSFNKEDFGQIDRVYVKGFRMVAPTPYSTGKQDAVIVILPYNINPVDSDIDKLTRYQYDVVRLHFSKGELRMWQKAEAIEGKPGRWKLTSKGDIISDVVDGVDMVDAHGVHDDGEVTGKNNPYSERQFYEDGL